MEWFFLWFVAAIVVGVGAGARGRNEFGWWLLAMLISPLLAVILLALMPNLRGTASASRASTNWITPGSIKIHGTRPCPFCAEDIKGEAIKCRFCGSAVELIAAPPAPADRVPSTPPPLYDLGAALGRLFRAVPPRVALAGVGCAVLIALAAAWIRAFLTHNV